jgi:aryl-alcohol dehydrogenase-like predicted oxidoreductase
MDYGTLGHSGLKVSKLCLGAMTFGEAGEDSFMHNVAADEETSHAIMSRAFEAGINFIDTADVYGQGLSERIVGGWLEKTKRRNEMVLATKCRFSMDEGPNGSGASRYRIIRCCEDSLRRLKTDRIDLYQIHMQDIETPEEETLRALDDLIHQGKVVYIGASNYAAYRLMESLWISDRDRLNRFVTLQAQYSLIVRELEREHVPLCNKHWLGILPWSPLGAGFLSGKYQRGQEPPSGTRMSEWERRWGETNNDRGWRILDTVMAIAKETDSTASQVSLAWLLSKPVVSSVIIGARTIAQLDDNLRSATLSLTQEQMQRLEEVSALDLGLLYAFMKRAQGAW